MDNTVIIASDSKDMQRTFSIDCNDSEGYSATVIEEIADAMHEFTDRVIVIDKLEDLASAILKSENPVVIPCYFGSASRSSKSLVPAICDALKTPYIGADAYVQSLCNDKYFSRLYARDFGLQVSDAILAVRLEDMSPSSFKRLSPPVVVKPNFGGGSNGIDGINVCTTYEEAFCVCERLLKTQRIPVIAENYAPGEEIQTIIVDLPDGARMIEQVGITINGISSFNTQIFDMSVKKRKNGLFAFERVKKVCASDLDVMEAVFKSLGKVGFMRFDCRVDEKGRATLLELSPDCSIAPGSGMRCAFENNGYSYSQMFEILIQTATLANR